LTTGCCTVKKAAYTDNDKEAVASDSASMAVDSAAYYQRQLLKSVLDEKILPRYKIESDTIK
jgi:hypothetical protein